MSRIGEWMQEPAHDGRVAAESDVGVGGGGTHTEYWRNGAHKGFDHCAR